MLIELVLDKKKEKILWKEDTVFDRTQIKFVCVYLFVLFLCVFFFFCFFSLHFFFFFFFFFYYWNAMPSLNDLPLNTVAADRSRRRNGKMKKEILMDTVITDFEFSRLIFIA